MELGDQIPGQKPAVKKNTQNSPVNSLMRSILMISPRRLLLFISTCKYLNIYIQTFQVGERFEDQRVDYPQFVVR